METEALKKKKKQVFVLFVLGWGARAHGILVS